MASELKTESSSVSENSPVVVVKSPRRSLSHFLRSLAFGLIFGLTAGISLIGMVQVVLLTSDVGSTGLATDPIQEYAIKGAGIFIVFFIVVFVTWMSFVRPVPKRRSGRKSASRQSRSSR